MLKIAQDTISWFCLIMQSSLRQNTQETHHRGEGSTRTQHTMNLVRVAFLCGCILRDLPDLRGMSDRRVERGGKSGNSGNNQKKEGGKERGNATNSSKSLISCMTLTKNKRDTFLLMYLRVHSKTMNKYDDLWRQADIMGTRFFF